MADTMIEVEDLRKHYGAIEALRGVSFTVPRGQVVGLLGPNGAGKSTAMRILTGYIAPTAGEARVDGHDVVEESMACRRRIGYLPEGNPLYLDLRLEEALHFAARMHGLRGAAGERAVKRSIDLAGLQGREHQLLGTLSKGYRQRAGLAQALLHDPSVLILDEPTSGLDPNQQEEMRTLIRTLGSDHTVILSTHILPEVEAVCDRVLIISEGRLCSDGTVEEIKTSSSSSPVAVVVVRGEAPRVREAIGGLDFVEEVNLEDVAGEMGVTRARVKLAGLGERAQLEALASAAHTAGLPLSELALETVSLGQIFAELTMGDEEHGHAAVAAATDGEGGAA
jgi:gliding motility-associated transport system ATP-binding protein